MFLLNMSSQNLENIAANLEKNGFTPIIVEKGSDAFSKVLELIPKGSEVMTMSSVTLNSIGITKEINEGGNYNSVKNKLHQMNRELENHEMQQLGAAPQYAIGSVHAVTENGEVLIASNTGSQLPAYAYASEHVIWVVGFQKVVKDIDAGIKRIYEYILPKESVRLAKEHNNPDLKSNVSKLLIINKEVKPNRITIILVKEELGF